MLPAFVACLIILTGTLIYLARDAFYFGNRSTFWRRTALAVPLVAISCASVWLLLWAPELAFRVPNPLGPDWNCEIYGKGGALVCFKR